MRKEVFFPFDMAFEQKSQHRLVVIYSGDRNTTEFPSPASYQLQVPWNLQRVHTVFLCTFISTIPGAPPLSANLQIEELQSSGKVDTTWSGGDGRTLATIPLVQAAGSRFYYEPSNPKEIAVLRTEDSRYYPSFTRLTISWVGENGALIANMPEHVMRLMFVSTYA